MNFLCIETNRNKNTLETQPIVVTLSNNLHEYELINLDASSQVENSSFITTNSIVYEGDFDVQELVLPNTIKYMGEIYVVNNNISIHDTDLLKQIMRWQMNTEIEILDGLEYVVTENNTNPKIIIIFYRDPSIKVGEKIAVFSSNTLSNNLETFQEFINTDMFKSIIQTYYNDDEVEFNKLETKVIYEGSEIAKNIYDLFKQNFNEQSIKFVENSLSAEDKKIWKLWKASHNRDGESTFLVGNERKVLDTKVLSDDEMEQIKQKIETLPETSSEYLAELTELVKSFEPTGAKSVLEESIKDDMLLFKDEDNVEALEESIKLVLERNPNASDNQILVELFASLLDMDLSYYEAIYEQKVRKEETTTAEELLNKYMNVLALLDENDIKVLQYNIFGYDKTLEKKIIYILDDLYNEGIFPLVGLKNWVEAERISFFLRLSSVYSFLITTVDKLLRISNNKDIYETILTNEFESYTTEIEKARQVLEQLKNQEEEEIVQQIDDIGYGIEMTSTMNSTRTQIKANQSTRGDTFTQEEILEINNYLKEEEGNLEEEVYNLLKNSS